KFKKDSVYLETDKGERRSYGSYYTPDHIVSYIVENTLAPLCNDLSHRLDEDIRHAEAECAAAAADQKTAIEDRLAALRGDSGNSLIGARLAELGSLPDAPPIFENPFRDEFRRRAPAIMETLSRIQQMPSDTTTQVKEKDRLLRTHFRPLSEAFRSVADLWCS